MLNSILCIGSIADDGNTLRGKTRLYKLLSVQLLLRYSRMIWQRLCPLNRQYSFPFFIAVTLGALWSAPELELTELYDSYLLILIQSVEVHLNIVTRHDCVIGHQTQKLMICHAVISTKLNMTRDQWHCSTLCSNIHEKSNYQFQYSFIF